MRRLAMLDLNDTLIYSRRDDGFVTSDGYNRPEVEREYDWLPGAKRALALFGAAGWDLAVVTNQPAEHRFADVTHAQMVALMGALSVQCGDAARVAVPFHVCYHEVTDGCECQKPEPGLLYCSMTGFVDGAPCAERQERSCMIGDQWSDVLAGQRAGVNTCKIGKWNAPIFTDEGLQPPDLWVPDVLAAARVITGVGL